MEEFKKENLFTKLDIENAPIGKRGIGFDSFDSFKEYLEGKSWRPSEILWQVHKDNPIPYETKCGQWQNFYVFPKYDMRGKTFRPFETCEEVESLLHFGETVKPKDGNAPTDKDHYLGSFYKHNEGIKLTFSSGVKSAELVFKNYTTEDGKPLGVEE